MSDKLKMITIRVPEELWARAKIKMVKNGDSFQGLLSKALEEYVKEEEQG